jgi:CBS domain-containing protein
MVARDVMRTTTDALAPELSVRAAARRLAAFDGAGLPVVDAGRLAGVLTAHDVVARVVAEGRDPDATTVGEVAEHSISSVGPELPLTEVVALLARQGRGWVPVADRGHLVGVVVASDLRAGLDDARLLELARVERRERARERDRDATLGDSFPASDPPA